MNETLAMFVVQVARYADMLLGVIAADGGYVLVFKQKDGSLSGKIFLKADGETLLNLEGEDYLMQAFKDYLRPKDDKVPVTLVSNVMNRMLVKLVRALSALMPRFTISRTKNGWRLAFDSDDMAGFVVFDKQHNMKVTVSGDHNACEVFKIDFKSMLECCGTHPKKDGEFWDVPA